MPTEKKLRIIHTEASPHWGGQEIRIFEEMKWFRDQGHEMILIAPDNGTLYQRCKDAGFEVISVYFTKPRTLLNILIMLWVLWRLKPDVVGTHSSTDSWAGLLAAFLLKIRKRIRYRHVSAPVKRNSLNKLQYRKLATNVITTGDCISFPLIDNLQLPASNVATIPTPINSSQSLPLHKDAKRRVQHNLGLPYHINFIGQVSVLRSWKGLNILIDAFNLLAEIIPDYHLLIVGDGPKLYELEMIRNQSLHKKRIHLLGHKKEPMIYMRAMDLVILASTKNEGIPQSLLQAMYSKVPALGTNIGGIPEIIKDQETGLLANANCADSLVAQIKLILKNSSLQRKLTTNAYEFVVDNFDRKKLGARIENIFLEDQDL